MVTFMANAYADSTDSCVPSQAAGVTVVPVLILILAACAQESTLFFRFRHIFQIVGRTIVKMRLLVTIEQGLLLTATLLINFSGAPL